MTPVKLRRNLTNPPMRSPSSTPSPDPRPFLKLPCDESEAFLPERAAWTLGGRGAVEEVKELVEVVAQRWFRLIEEVMAWISWRRRMTGGRSVGRDMVET